MTPEHDSTPSFSIVIEQPGSSGREVATSTIVTVCQYVIDKGNKIVNVISAARMRSYYIQYRSANCLMLGNRRGRTKLLVLLVVVHLVVPEERLCTLVSRNFGERTRTIPCRHHPRRSSWCGCSGTHTRPCPREEVHALRARCEHPISSFHSRWPGAGKERRRCRHVSMAGLNHGTMLGRCIGRRVDVVLDGKLEPEFCRIVSAYPSHSQDHDNELLCPVTHHHFRQRARRYGRARG